MKPMKWKPAAIPKKESGKGTFWEQKISPELERAMKLNPGQTFQLLDDNGEPAELLFLDSETLRSSCQRPFRLQARRVKGRETHRHVWVSMDPAHWERVDKQYAKKGPKTKKENAK